MKGIHKLQMVDGQSVTIDDDLEVAWGDGVLILRRPVSGRDGVPVCIVPLSALLAYVVTGYQR